jgi:RNA polymerase sigma factor (sigma-70 family)
VTLFPTTVWTVIKNAGAGRATAQGDFVTRYRPAVVRFARLRGVDAAQAEDIAQEVFLRIFDDRVLEKADSALGRFRSLVLAVTRHVLGHHFARKKAKKRGGGQEPIAFSSGDSGELSLEEILAQDVRDPEFDREWLAQLLTSSLKKLESENATYYACIHAFLVEEKSHKEIAAKLGRTEAVVRNAISRGRARLVAILREEISGYASSSNELEDEVRYLQGLLGLTEK